MAGLFITMEGTDGSGKTLQSKILSKYLIKKGFKVIITREPGGTEISEKIRDIIIDKKNSMMDNYTEALLYAAARAQIVAEIIQPNLESGNVVICDRFLDSSIVYQGIARGLGIDTIENINKFATKGISPDITFFMDIPPEKALARRQKASSLDRIEMEKIEFHKNVYLGYKKLATMYNKRIYTIDANDIPTNIHNNIVSIINKYLEGVLL